MKHKRFLSILIVLAMYVGLLPTTAFAYVYYGGTISSDVEESQDTILLNADTTIAESVTFALVASYYQYIKLNYHTLTNYGTITTANSSNEFDGGTFYNYGVCEITGFYNVAVYDLTLSSITLSSGTLSSSFAAGTREYAVTVDNSVTSIDITPTLNTGTGVKSMTVNGTTATSGAASTVSLSVGENSIPIVITANDGSDTTNTYTLTVTRQSVSCSHSSYTNGFCDDCGAYEPATQNSDGVYEIANAGQLFWFASLVNGDTTQEGITTAVADANAVLTANIDLESKSWTPIGTSSSYPFKGTFDGKDYTVSGLYINGSSSYIGLFGYVGSGTVQNVTVSGTATGYSNVGGVVGVNAGTVTNCTNCAAVSATTNVGGVVGFNSDSGTVTYCYNSGSITGTGNLGGVVGYNSNGTVTNCINSGTVTSTSTGYDYVGGVVGYTGGGTVKNCYNSGTVSGHKYVGGAVGYNSASVSYCYNSGTVSCTGDTAGGVVGYNYSSGSTSNCYYLTGTATAGIGSDSGSTSVAAKTTTQFASGEVTWLLTGGVTDGTQVWYQTLGTDSYPVLDSTHGTVYYTSAICDGSSASYSTYSNSSAIHVGYDENGFCTGCGGYQPATLNSEGVYEISNAGQLFWFASLVNGDSSQEGISAANTSANAILTADIDLSVTTSTHTSTEWTPIGDYGSSTELYYSGTFDGKGYTVSGLYINSTNNRQGLFGYVNDGTVQNVNISGSVTATGNRAGIAVGHNTGTVKNITVSAVMTVGGYAGGAVGYNNGTVQEVSVSGTVTSDNNRIGGVVGFNDGGSVESCYSSATVSSSYMNVGGVVGYNNGIVTNCYNSGEVSGRYVGGVVGWNNSGSVSNCYSSGNVSGSSNVGGVIGLNNDGSGGTFTNCYYLEGTADLTIGDDPDTAADDAVKTTAEFASGEVTWLLNSGTTDGAQAWYQNIDNGNTADSFPVLDSTHGTVYYSSECAVSASSLLYSNSNSFTVSHAEFDEYGFCTICGGYQPATINSDGVYEISNAGQLFWFASLVNGDTTQEGITAANTSANAVLTADIDLNVTTSTHTSTEWTPIGTKSAPYKGTFDGGSYTVSGLSVTTATNTTEAVYVGLFGYINAGTVKDLTVSGKIDVSGSTIYAGGIVGTVHNSVLSNLTSNVDVTAEATVKGTFGGVAASVEGTGDGSAHSTMERCVNYGTVTAKGVLDCVGGLTGFMNSATITNSINYGKVDTSGGTAAASAGIYTGGIVSYINNANAIVTNCVNVGEISGVDSSSIVSYTGAIVGRINANVGEVSNCYYLDTTASTGVGGNGNSSATVETTAQTAAEFATGAAAWSLQDANTDYVWGQDLTSDAYPVLTSADSKKVVKVTFYKSTTGIVLMESYTNADGTLSSYLTGSDYTFYSDYDLTKEISNIGTLTFDTDTDIYVVTAHDLIIRETNGGTILEGTNYTYDDNLLTVLTGGNYTISGTSATDTIKVTASDDVAITLYGVNITSGSKPPMEIDGTGTVAVKLSDENTLESTNGANAGLQLSNANLIITSADGDGKTTGSLDATGGTWSAGIGSCRETDMSGSITINGGTVSGTSPNNGAGIGSGDKADMSGSITINGGTVSGTSIYGAGIGGGEQGNMSGSITINGGTVSGTSSTSGAGIGSGHGVMDLYDNKLNQLSGSITINGGTVSGTSSDSGAGIGCGENTDMTGIISISGGYITAESANSDAITKTNVNITGGYFADNGYTASTVYSNSVASGYAAYANVEDTKGDYPARVLPTAWTAAVTYATGGADGTTPSDDTDYGYGDKVTVDATLPLKKDGYAQTGWSLSSTDTTAVTTFNISGDTTLYPVFARQFTDSGASDISLTYGEAITAIDLSDYIEFVDDTTFTSTNGEFTFALASGSELPAGLTLNEGIITGTPTAAAEAQSVSFTVTDKTPYIMLASLDSTPATVSATLTLVFTVAKAASSVDTAPTAATGLTYNGSAQELVSAGTATGGEMQYSLSESGTYSADIPTATNAGTYTVYYKAVGDSNHSDTSAESVSVTIAELPIELTWDYTSFVYDGKEKTVTATITNAVGDDVVNPTYSGTTSATEVGSYTAEVSAVSNTNYTLTGATGLTLNWSIVQSTTGGTVSTYNGGTATDAFTYGDTITVKATLEATGTASGLTISAFTPISTATAAIFNGETQISDAVAVTNGTETTLTVDTTDLGASDSAYTLTLKYYGDDNMAATELNFNVTVAKATPTYTVPTGLTATYGDTLADVALTSGWSWDDDTSTSVGNAGTHEFAATYTPSDTANYNTVTETLTVTVGKAAQAAPGGLTVTEPSMAGGTGTISGLTTAMEYSTDDGVNWTAVTSDTLTVDDGITVYIRYAETANYYASDAEEIEISTTVPSYVIPTGITATYGDTLASVTLPTATNGTWTWDDDTQSVGSVGTNEFTAVFKPTDSNYNTVTTIVDVTVAARPITVEWSSASFVYDGNAKSVTATITNIVDSDEVNLTYNGTTSATDVGSYTAEVSAISNANYTLTGATGLTNNWSMVQSTTDGAVSTYNGDTLTNAYTYGDTITVKATLDATGEAATVNNLLSLAYSGFVSGTAAVFNGDVQISDAVTIVRGAETTLTVDTTDLGASDSAYTLTLKYYGDDNMAATTLDFNVTVAKATPTYTAPTGLTATYGDTLSSVTLPDNWAWVDGNMSVGDVGTHEFEATFSPDDTDNYETVTVNLAVTVGMAEPSYEVPSGLTAVYGDTLASVELPDNWSWVDSSLSVGNVGTNTFSATYTPTDTTNYESVTVNVSVTVEKATPDYTVPTGLTAVYGDTLSTVTLPDNWAWETPTASVGDAGDNTFTAVYTPEDSTNYNTATETLTVSVAKAEQSAPTGLTVTQPDEQTSTGIITGVTADMEYSLDGGDTWEDITDDTLIIDPGTVLIRYAETENYNASAAVEITIDASNPSYTTPTDLTAVYGDTLADVELPNADNGVWTWVDEDTSVGNAGTNTFTAVFTPDDDNYNTVYVEISVTVEKATPDYTEPTGLTATYGDTLATVTLPDGWSWADATANVGNAGTNTFTAIFTPEDSTNYETVTAEVDVTVGKATPTYDLPTGLTATYGDTLASVELPDGWTWVDDTQSVGDAGTHEFAAVYTPDDTDNYETVTAEISVTVSSTALTVAETPTAARVKRGNTLSKSTLSGGSVTTADGTEVSGTWVWSDGTETMSKTGTYERTAVFTADDETYGTVEATVTVTVYTSSSGGSSGGSSSGTTTYAVTSEEFENGDVSFNSSNAQSGATVTITVTPDDGYETESITVTDASGNDIEVTANDDGTYSFTMPSSKVSVSAEFKEIDTDTEPTTEPTEDDTHDCPSEKFTDVDTSLWYHEYIDYVLENGLMNGTGDTTFEPNTTTTRAMIVTVLYRLEGEPTSGTSQFADVASGDWYANAVAWAAENGIVLGCGDGTFGANDVITREQTATILYRYADYKGADTSVGEDTNILSYTDADEISEYAIPAMQWAVGTGLVNGKGDNVLDPQGGATRAETAAMLMRFIEAE
ncbi:MAG: S-layer homology domain-containing protein [Clostridia bacterium]|nr:S-layer homology domain-containing protein [Clostridia bacterium]